jgi:hypothetical protein
VEGHKGPLFWRLAHSPEHARSEGACRDPSHPCRRQFQAHCRRILAFRRLM